MKSLLSFISLVLAIGVSFYQAMVFMFFFNWFVVTTFNLPVIGYWTSFALIITVGVLRTKGINKALLHYEKKNMGDEEKHTMEIANTLGVFVALNFALFVGWLIQLNI